MDDLFNTYLKGKYAYWIRMRYVIPFDFISQTDYISFEDDVDKLLKSDVKYWDSEKGDLGIYIDVNGTDSANNIMPFVRANKFTTDDDLTIDEIKRFRTWLAETLLTFDSNMNGVQKNELYTESFTKVLEYYAGGMFNDVVKALMEIDVTFNISTPGVSNCGCGSGTSLSDLYGWGADICDPLGMYRKHIYNEMVKKFSDVDFWSDFSDIFLIEFKAYIDNIIRLNLPLTASPYVSNFTDCSCVGQEDSQEAYMEILKRLSKSLEYIYSGETKGHLNYISKAFTDWSTTLYELMEWTNK